MKTLKLITLVSFLLSCLTVSAGTPDSLGSIKTLDGKIVGTYGEKTATDFRGWVFYHEASNKIKHIDGTDIKWMREPKRVYCGYSSSNEKPEKKNYGLSEVIALTKDYVLVYNGTIEAGVLYVYNVKDSKKISNESLPIGYYHKKSLKESAETLEKLRGYFSSCKDLLAKMKQNLDAEKLLVDGINAVSYDGGPEIKDYMETYKDYRTQ
jgi:hypothetical protein